MRNKYYTSRDPIKNYFPLPNEVFTLGLSPGALAVYSYLMYIEDRTTYQCHASYKTIGKAVNMSPNTVRKYVTELVERGLIQTEHTSIITQDGRKQNGSLLYTLLPIQFSIQQFYEQKLAKLDAECEQERIRKRLEAFQQAQQELPVRPREPRVAAVSDFPGTAGRRSTGSSKPDVAPPCGSVAGTPSTEEGHLRAISDREQSRKRRSRRKPRCRARTLADTSARSAGSLGLSDRGC